MTAVPIVELVAYAIIGLAALLIVGGAAFLTALHVYERIEGWRINANAKKRGVRVGRDRGDG